MDQPPEWFWSVIERSKPSLKRLAEWLEAAPKEAVIRFAFLYELAAEEVADFSSGPDVDGVQYSEDDTEDLCNWVVSQGSGLWRKAITREIDLASLARLNEDSRRNESAEYQTWVVDVSDSAYDGYLAPHCLAHPIYRKRFGLSLLEELTNMN